MNPLEKRDNLIAFRASTNDRSKAEELKLHMKLGSTADVFRHLLDQSYQDMQESTYGVGLRFLPELTYKEMIKVDWSWLP